MSKRVSIELPSDNEARPSTRASAASNASPRTSVKQSPTNSIISPTASVSKSPRNSQSEPPELSELKSQDEPSENIAEPLSMTDLFPDGCERYKKDCCCCHCIGVRHALRQAAYLRTPEGKRRLELKMHMKDFFMDINAITELRNRTENLLHGTTEYPPSADKSFPITIVKVSAISNQCMSIEWYQHDDSYISHYEIYVDNCRRKRVFDPNLTSTIILDVNMKRTHKIVMKTIPKKCLGSNASPLDKLMRDACCYGLKKVLQTDYFCHCDKNNKMDEIEKAYKRNSCQELVDFWKDSEYLYIPVCDCAEDCDCDCLETDANECP